MVHWVYVLKCEDDRIYVGETRSLYKRWNQHLNGTTKCTKAFPPLYIIGLYNISKNIAFINYQNDNNLGKLLATFNIYWDEMYTNNISNFDIENYITEHFMKNLQDNWWKVRGGKYTNLIDTVSYEFHCQNKICKDNTCDDCIFWSHKRKEMIESGFEQLDNSVNIHELSNCSNPVIDFLPDRPNCHCGYPSEINMYNNELYYNCPLKSGNKWIEFDDLDIQENCNFYKKYTSECLI